ncbi:MAG TPA: nucleotidyltransferase family protein [Candidatus Limnocylindrales bacterium]
MTADGGRSELRPGDGWRSSTLPASATVRDAMERLDAAATQIVLVVDADDRLLGTITDGDIRRALLRQTALDATVDGVMNPHPITAPAHEPPDALVALMRDRHVHQLPLLDADGRLAGLRLLDRLLARPDRPNAAVVMAGGRGTRLRPLTDRVPKPLLHVGGRPLLDTTLELLAEHAIRHVYLSVNYLAEQVIEHVGDGASRGLRVEYLRETEPLGTAGALSLLPAPPAAPLIVMNGDILTRLDLGQLIDFHDAQRAELTMCIRQVSSRVPYGVVDLDEGRVVSITEKPEQQHFVNAGIYVLEPRVLAGLEPGRHKDMTELAQEVGARGGSVAAFPIREYWLDIGQPADFERASADYDRVFGG